MSAARTPGAMVLDVESRNQLVDCPGCGVIAQGHGRVVMEVIDLPRSRPRHGSGGTTRLHPHPTMKSRITGSSELSVGGGI